MLTSANDQFFLDLRGLPSPHGALPAHELLLLHPDRDTPRNAQGVPLEAAVLPDYQRGPDGQLLCSTGTAPAPPATHLLDALVRTFALVDEEEAMLCRAVHTVALVGALPACDLCPQGIARYDVSLRGPGQSTWAFVCASCYRSRPRQLLGTGRGQVLVVWQEVPVSVQAICRALTDRLGRTPINT